MLQVAISISLALDLDLHFMDLAFHLPDAFVGLLHRPTGPFGGVGVLDGSGARACPRLRRLRPLGTAVGLPLLTGRHPQAGSRTAEGVGLTVQLGLVEFVGHPFEVERRVLE
jgi:hypothetical protein